MFDARVDGDGFIKRLTGALRLDLNLYERVSGDVAATSQAWRIVLLAGVSNGLGLIVRVGTIGVVAGVGAALLGWLLWTAVIWLMAMPFGQRRADRSLFRTLGFANAPGLFLILGAVPVIGGLVRLLVVVWLVATTVRAVQATFAMTPRRAIAVALLGFVVYLVLGATSSYFAS